MQISPTELQLLDVCKGLFCKASNDRKSSSFNDSRGSFDGAAIVISLFQ